MNLTDDQFYELQDKNKLLYEEVLRTGAISAPYHFIEGVRYSRMTQDKWADVQGSMPIGAVPSIAKSGIDSYYGIRQKTAIFPLEVKAPTIEVQYLWRGEGRGDKVGVYRGKANIPENRATLESCLVATYNLHTEECLQTKYVNTALVIHDMFGNLVDARMLEANSIQQAFSDKSDRNSNTLGTVNIKASQFLNNGFLMPTLVPKIGFDEFKELLIRCCPVVKKGEAAPVGQFNLELYKKEVIALTGYNFFKE